MTTTRSDRFFVYLQRPDTGEWVTVGRYRFDEASGQGMFRYAPSYEAAGLTWAIDPVNLPFITDLDHRAARYEGLHDVLRDAGPDSWGQALLRREHGLPERCPPIRYLPCSGNADRWGALAIGPGVKPSVAHLASPPLPMLDALIAELQAMADARPPVDATLRRRLVRTPSLGGARPKTTVRDPQGAHWIVKPGVAADVADVPALEHAAQQWGRASGLDFAQTLLHAPAAGRSALRVRRFDRQDHRRAMCVSAASLLQVEHPGGTIHERGSYPRLAEALRLAGAPVDDQRELFGRMIFNAVCGNDDDHVRNHAIVWREAQRRWRLSPAFDVVPNAAETPTTLHMAVSLGRHDIARDAMLADARRFGFASHDEAAVHLDALLARIEAAFDDASSHLDAPWRALLRQRMETVLGQLRR